MEAVIVSPTTDDYDAGVNAFLTSPGGIYAAYRYGPRAQRFLLQVFTLSGLDPWYWGQYVMQHMAAGSSNGRLLSLLSNESSSMQSSELQAAVADICNFASNEEAPVGEPPLVPTYLAGYDYTQADYLTDLATVYGAPIPVQYESPWPDSSFVVQKPLVRPVLLCKAAAIMGATAGAIERLIKQGGNHGDHRG